MTDKPKTIQEILAEVQKNVELINEEPKPVESSVDSSPKTGFAGKLPAQYGFRAYTKPGSGAAKTLGKIAGTSLGPAGTVAAIAAPELGKAMSDRYKEQHAGGLIPHPTTPGVSAADSFERMRKMKAPETSATKEVPTISAPKGPTKVAPPSTAVPPKTSSNAQYTKGGYFMKSPSVSKGDYTIKKGETLSGIAKAQGTTVGAIQSMNKGLKDINKISAGGSLNLPTTTKSTATPAVSTPAPTTKTDASSPTTSAAPAPSSTPIKDFIRDTMTGKIETPIMDRIKGKTPESESGGKKKMSEESNPLIAAFLKLQETKAGNMFEAAKKAKKDYDGDGKIESPKDEVWGSRFRAAKAAGKMEEGMLDPKDPSVQSGSDVTSSPIKSVKPAAPKKVDGDPSYQGSGEVTKDNKPTRVKEEVEFSQAEIDHINSFFLEASVAPNRPEVAIGADSTSDKMSQNDVTGTSTEGGRKKKACKEETDAADESNMAKTQLKAMASKAMNLNAKLKKSKNLPAWVQSKLAVAKDGVTAVDDFMTHSDKIKEETLEEGRPRKNPESGPIERDARQHIQVIAGRAAAGNTLDFPHNDGSKSKITPAMGRKITSHLQGLKPAERQAAVNKMHASAEGLKI